MGGPSHIVFRKRGFLSSTAMGLSAIVITIVLCCTGIIIYGVHLASEQSGRIITLAQSTVRGLPEFAEALPPVVADMLNDRRRPDYSKDLAITAQPTRRPDDATRVTIEVVNNGSEVVSLLSLRLLVLDEYDQILCESNEWAATPFAAEGGWRGPIMPGSRRYFVCGRRVHGDISPVTELRTEVEITELRVWNGPRTPTAPNELPAEATASSPDPTAAPDNG